jgi:CHAT domain-containing protein
VLSACGTAAGETGDAEALSGLAGVALYVNTNAA